MLCTDLRIVSSQSRTAEQGCVLVEIRSAVDQSRVTLDSLMLYCTVPRGIVTDNLVGPAVLMRELTQPRYQPDSRVMALLLDRCIVGVGREVGDLERGLLGTSKGREQDDQECEKYADIPCYDVCRMVRLSVRKYGKGVL
jgi:hypothetical protein